MKLFEVMTANKWMFCAFFAIGILFTGCLKEDVYKGKDDKGEIPAPEEFPDFSTRSTINLSVNYEAPGRKTLVEIFTEYPFEMLPDGSISKKEMLPVFAAYTNDNSKLTAEVKLPTVVKEVYLCTSSMGMPQCVVVEVKDGAIQFKTSDLYTTNTKTTRAITTLDELWKPVNWAYSLCDWGDYGIPKGVNNYLTDVKGTSSMIQNIQYQLWNKKSSKPNGLDNSKLTVEEKYTNISIAKTFVENGQTTTVESAEVFLTFLAESAWYQNVFGYYYYPTNQKPVNPAAVTKYIVLPNVSMPGHPPYGATGNGGLYYDAKNAPIKPSQQLQLLYVDGDGKVSKNFPPGYTIGWFIVPDGFNARNGGSITNYPNYIYSNESWNSDGKKRCIALNYVGSNGDAKVVLGFEDGADKSFEDILFYVESNPKGAILDPDKPTIDEGGDIEVPDKDEERIGTYVFEDQWPQKGDYDMNDVVVEYKRVVTFDKDNMVKKIVDTFKPVQRVGSANYKNAFAYQITAGQEGTFTLSEGVKYEKETNSFIVYSDVAGSLNKEIVITRNFASGALAKSALKDYNPFIISQYKEGNQKRTEVHLPKQKPTIFADESLALSKDDAYYMDKSGKYPFALDLPIWGFIQPVEKTPIDDPTEYPEYTKWVAGGCKEIAADWYKKHLSVK